MVTLNRGIAEQVADVIVGKMLDHSRKANNTQEDPAVRHKNLSEAQRLYELSVAVDPEVVSRVNLKPILKQIAVLKEHLTS